MTVKVHCHLNGHVIGISQVVTVVRLAWKNKKRLNIMSAIVRPPWVIKNAKWDGTYKGRYKYASISHDSLDRLYSYKTGRFDLNWYSTLSLSWLAWINDEDEQTQKTQVCVQHIWCTVLKFIYLYLYFQVFGVFVV